MPLNQTLLIERIPAFANITKYDDRDAWLAARANRLGGSQMGSLYGFSWGEEDTLYGLWASKIGLLEPSDKKKKGAGNMRRGRGFEGPILAEVANEMGWTVEHWPQNWVVAHPDETLRLAVTPDGLGLAPPQWAPYFPEWDGQQPIAMQVKSASPYAKKGWPRDADGNLEVPAHYIPQTQSELDCLGLRYGVLVVLFGMDFDDIELIPYERSDAFAASAHERLRWFWGLVDNEEKPPVDGSENTWDFLKRLYPSEDGTAVELPGDADVWFGEWKDAAEERKLAEERERLAKNQLINAIGEATWARTPGGEGISYKEQSRSGWDSEKLRADFPEAAAACEKISRFRVLRALSKLPKEAIAALGAA